MSSGFSCYSVQTAPSASFQRLQFHKFCYVVDLLHLKSTHYCWLRLYNNVFKVWFVVKQMTLRPPCNFACETRYLAPKRLWSKEETPLCFEALSFYRPYFLVIAYAIELLLLPPVRTLKHFVDFCVWHVRFCLVLGYYHKHFSAQNSDLAYKLIKTLWETSSKSTISLSASVLSFIYPAVRFLRFAGPISF